MSDFIMNLFIASTSSFISSCFCTPIENVPTSILQKSEQKNLSHICRGILTNTIKYIPHSALTFAFKDAYSNAFLKKSNDYKNIKNLFLGSLAGVSTMFVIYPYEYVKSRTTYLQKVVKRTNVQWRDCFIEILKTNKILGFYKGFGACTFPIIIFRGLQLGIYDNTKDITQGLPFIGQLFWVQILTFVSHIISFPFFKIMIMMKADSLNFNHKSVRYKNFIDCTNQILKSQKLIYLFEGSSQKFLLATKDAMTLILYYNIQQYFQGKQTYKN
ncbi:unnamed protein product [Paramecium sonneborni]|uniref:ADP/ATP translocase n=1 Tax=Paramecium sonneborni TaxID=65129 RepID=A0A8S1PJ57_9CILI|nr:unnamed protein product [Paramecium sonneborni]